MISLTSPVKTRAHHWPAGLKLGLLCCATVVLFWLPALWMHALGMALALMFYAAGGRRFFIIGLGRLKPLWPIVLVLLIWHGLTDDLIQGATVLLRMGAAVALANLVTMTTPLSQMMGVVQRLAGPLQHVGLPPRQVALALALVIRFIPVLAQKGHLLTLAWRARAVRKVGWRIVTPFAVLAIDDAEHVAEALRARGGL